MEIRITPFHIDQEIKHCVSSNQEEMHTFLQRSNIEGQFLYMELNTWESQKWLQLNKQR